MTEAIARLRIVAPQELAAGFQMGGATVHAVDSATQAATTVESLIAEGEKGVIGVYGPWFEQFESAQPAQPNPPAAPVGHSRTARTMARRHR